MADLFLQLVNKSITAGWLILAVVLLRFLMKKTPRWIYCLMWGVVGLRLVMPFSVESVLSLIPSAQTLPQDIAVSAAPAIDSGFPVVDTLVNPVISQHLAPVAETAVYPVADILSVLTAVWAVGAAAMLLYGLVSCHRLYGRLGVKLGLYENIYISDNIETPFILGFLYPKIYIPSAIPQQEVPYILAHEQAHLKRGDHWWKGLGYVVLCLHWFNPLVWLCYFLLSRDIETACDERVVSNLCEEERRAYSRTLLSCSTRQLPLLATPLAFGELAVKDRIIGVLRFRQPRTWVVVTSLLMTVVLGVCFLTDPVRSAAVGGEPIGRLDSHAAFETQMSKRLDLHEYTVSKYTAQSGGNTKYRYVYEARDSRILDYRPNYYHVAAGGCAVAVGQTVLEMGKAGWQVTRINGEQATKALCEQVIMEAWVVLENEAGDQMRTSVVSKDRNCLARVFTSYVETLDMDVRGDAAVFGGFHCNTTVDDIVRSLGYPQALCYSVSVDSQDGRSSDIQLQLTYRFYRENGQVSTVIFTLRPAADEAGVVAERLTAVSYRVPMDS